MFHKSGLYVFSEIEHNCRGHLIISHPAGEEKNVCRSVHRSVNFSGERHHYDLVRTSGLP